MANKLEFVNFASSESGMQAYEHVERYVQAFLNKNKITKEQIVSMAVTSFGNSVMTEYSVSMLVEIPEEQESQS